MNVFYMARCLACDWKMTSNDYLLRSSAVGDHRVRTGHNVHMWLEPKAE